MYVCIYINIYQATIQVASWEKSKKGMERLTLKDLSLLLKKLYFQVYDYSIKSLTNVANG